MAITVTRYDTATLLGVFRFFIDSKTYWLDNFFQQEIHSENEFIEWGKITDVRRIAPLVAPLAQGKPIFSEAGTAVRVRPSYSKMKDAIGPTRVLRRRPGEIADPNAGGTMQSRWNSYVVDILRAHREAAQRLNEWMAARAVIDAQITLYGEAMPERTVIYGRDAGQTVVLAGAARWGQSGVSIISLLELWTSLMRSASFGAPPTRITVGANVFPVMRANQEIRDLMSLFLNVKNAPEIILGMREMVPGVEYVGSLSPTLDVFVYNDFYHAPDGTATPYMSPNDVVLSSPMVNGVRCFGAILDPHANYRPLSLYPRMYIENDPPVTMILTQSAPLMVPVNPNATFKATVL